MAVKSLHVAIIPDGNRRWAKRRLLQPWKGHEQAVETCRTLIDWCHESPDVAVLTLWGFSTENWNRSAEEVSQLMRIYEEFLRKERPTFLEKQTRFVHSGRSDRIPESLVRLIREIAAETNEFTKFTLNFALDHGGRDEVVRAIQKVTEPQVVTAESFRNYLDHPELPDIDLIIRTSGEQRSSGFFIWQAAYAEWVYTQSFFPDLTPDAVAAAVAEFKQRQRRFGA